MEREEVSPDLAKTKLSCDLGMLPDLVQQGRVLKIPFRQMALIVCFAWAMAAGH
jgi:hypothetical protein